NQIENVIRSKVRNSFYNFSPMSEQAEKILKLTDIRLDLLELKEITKDALSKLSEYDRTLIYYKYFGIKPKDDSFDLKSRNYFRKQNKALDRFNYILKEKGYNEDWFIKKYFRISFIAGAYQKMISEEGKKHAKY
ncbi:MAG: hypothetical protein J6Q38_01010, partial [Clostridia bacterium]|nr:hypothetical protein [Clostridia bacterium]